MTTTRLLLLLATVIAVGFIALRPRPLPAPAAAIVKLPTAPPAALPKPTQTAAITPPKPTAPPTPVLPPLPQVEMSEAIEHAVPSLPMTERPTQPLDLRSEELPIPETSPSYQSLAPEYRPIQAAAPSKPRYFAGTAQVTGATSLIVDGVPVELYGVERPRASDRCDGNADCATAAEQALQSRVADNAQISCRLARPSLGVVVFATCLDSQGTDLGGLLAGQGLVRANARETYAYLGAEHIARDLRKGLWAGR